jgi:small subunit ribosomal protein S17
VPDEKNTENENIEETPAEEKPKRTRKKAEPEAAAPEAAEKPKRTRKKAEAEEAVEPAEAEAVEPAEAPDEAESEPTPEPVAEEAPAEEPVPKEPVAEEAPAEEPAPAEPVAEAEPAADVEAEAPAVEAPEAEGGAPDAVAPAPTRGPKPKKKRLPRSERHKHIRPRREKPAQRKPITRLSKPEGERGRDQQRRGIVVSAAMDKTIVVRVDSVKAHPKYKKVIRRSKKFHAHDEQNQAKAGDVVRIVETRPLSKTKRWRLAEILEVAK